MCPSSHVLLLEHRNDLKKLRNYLHVGCRVMSAKSSAIDEHGQTNKQDKVGIKYERGAAETAVRQLAIANSV